MSTLPSWDLPEGAEIAPGRSVLRLLGGGNRFEVFLVWDEPRLAVMVAKVLRPHVVKKERVLRDLRLEAEALSTLAHPVIVRGFDAVLDGAHPHLLIEHLEGATLRSLIHRGGALPMQQLLPLALHIASAIHYLAASGWVHLDIKPDNVVMGIPPRLIDLSLAMPVADAQDFSAPVGTDAYMPPEQCLPGSAAVGPPSDVYGLAATLWHAAAGARPWPRGRGDRDAEDPELRFPQLARDPQPLPRAVPPGFEDVLRACLARDPAVRPAAAEFAAALEPLVAQLPRKMSLSKRRL
ncbi:MAG TPA: serine/threonine-protein kinase [Solirubrobacteraceae bacterium]|nr:serine/threonine-protein kinase [Solirubrobacteraceae bacterium]